MSSSFTFYRIHIFDDDDFDESFDFESDMDSEDSNGLLYFLLPAE